MHYLWFPSFPFNLGGFFFGKRFVAQTKLEKQLAKDKTQKSVEKNLDLEISSQDRGDFNV